MRNLLGKIIAFLVVGLVVFSAYSLFTMDESWNDINKKERHGQPNSKEINKETALFNLEQVLSVEIETEASGSIYVHAKDSNGNGFTYYGKIDGTDKEIANALGVKDGQTIFINDQNKELYVIETNQVLMTFKDSSADDIREEMNTMLERIGITFEELKVGLTEKYQRGL